MKKGWRSMTLAEVCQFSNGLWKGENPPYENVGVIRNTNFTKDGTLDYSEIAYHDVEAKKLEKRRLIYGDIILEKSGGGPKQPVGRVALFDKDEGDFSFSNFTSALRVRQPEELDFRFVHKFLHWTYLSGVTEGMQSNSTGIRNLNGDAYKSIEICFPPLSEQHRIVAMLDDAFANIAIAKANAEQNLKNARALFESYLDEVFTKKGDGWVEKRLGDVATRLTNGFVGPTRGIYLESGVPYLLARHVKNNRLQFDGRTFISNEFNSKNKKSMLKSGDVLLVQSGHIGHSAVVPEEHEGHNCHAMIVITAAEGAFIGPYLSLFFNSSGMRRKFQEIRSGSTVPHLTCGEVRELMIPMPDLETQRCIVDHLHELEQECQRLTRLYEQKLVALEELKKSLLHQAFNGEL
jgi:type I restriction enzyme S subunit